MTAKPILVPEVESLFKQELKALLAKWGRSFLRKTIFRATRNAVRMFA